MAIVVITTSPDPQVVLQAGVLDGSGVTIVNNKITRSLSPGNHSFVHTIDGPTGASCGIKITQDGTVLVSVEPANHSVVDGESDDTIPVQFTCS